MKPGGGLEPYPGPQRSPGALGLAGQPLRERLCLGCASGMQRCHVGASLMEKEGFCHRVNLQQELWPTRKIRRCVGVWAAQV